MLSFTLASGCSEVSVKLSLPLSGSLASLGCQFSFLQTPGPTGLCVFAFCGERDLLACRKVQESWGCQNKPGHVASPFRGSAKPGLPVLFLSDLSIFCGKLMYDVHCFTAYYMFYILNLIFLTLSSSGYLVDSGVNKWWGIYEKEGFDLNEYGC